MTTPDTLAYDFGHEHFGSADLGDQRRTRRLIQAANLIVRRPDETLPHKLHTPADLQAFYRLMNCPTVTHAAVLAPHRERTRQLMSQHAGPVLVIHDGTELDYTSKKSLTSLGPIGNGSCRGYICHNSLAIAADSGTIFGLANQILHHRSRGRKGETRSQSRQRRDRESRLWVQGAEAVGPMPTGACWVHVCDRGADTFEALERFSQLGQFVVRSSVARAIYLGHQTPTAATTDLHTYARSLPTLAEKSVAVHYRPADRKGRTRRPAQPQRTTTVRIAAAAVQLQAPHVHRGEHSDQPLAVWIVHVREINPPPGAEPLEWFLLTNHPVHTAADALEVVQWYELRWTIEEFHKAMKTGCRIESPQFTSEEALQPTIAVLSVVAAWLLSLRELARRPEVAGQPAQAVISPLLVATLCQWRHGQDRPDWTVRDFVMALGRLGGHQNRKGDGLPGWLTLWRGWQVLQSMIEGVRIARRQKM